MNLFTWWKLLIVALCMAHVVDGEGGGANEENDDVDPPGDDPVDPPGDTDPPADKELKDDRPLNEQMKDAISEGLKTPPGSEPPPGDKKTPPADDKTKAPPADDKTPPADGDKKKPAGDDKVKTAADFELTDQMKAVLKPEAQQRFQGLITHTKAVEEKFATLDADYRTVVAGREKLTEALKSHGVDGPEELIPLLELNLNLMSGNYEDAYKFLKPIYEAVVTHLGIDPGAIDPLTKHADLAKDVDEGKITRERALELARTRNDATMREGREQQTRETQEQQQAVVQARNKAMDDIERWTTGLSKSDVDYSKKEAKILADVKDVVTKYPPDQWLKTLTLLYSKIVVEPTVNKQRQPLRPGGGGSGLKTEHTDMGAAIREGLGYS